MAKQSKAALERERRVGSCPPPQDLHQRTSGERKRAEYDARRCLFTATNMAEPIPCERTDFRLGSRRTLEINR